MQSSYGGTDERRSDESVREREDDEASLSSVVKGGGQATILSSTVNITNTIIGSGALAFPHAFASMGLLPGIISCLFSASTAAFGLYLLSRCAAQVPVERRRQTSFNEVAKMTFGKGWATRGFDAAIAIKCFGVSISYLIIIKTLVPQVLISVSRALKHHPDPTSILLNGDFWLLLSMTFIVPLSFFRKLDSLRFTSQIALAAVAYLVAVVVGWWLFKGVSPKRGEVVLARFGRSTLANFPVQVFAYTCAQNLFPMFNELKDNTQRRMNLVIGSSLGASAATYEILGIIGYITFGSTVGSNVIAMYPATSYLVAVGQLGIALFVGLSYPLQLLPCRQCIHTLTAGFHTKAGGVGKDDDEHEALVGGAVEDKGAGEMSQAKFVGSTAAILISGLVIALLVDDLGVVMSFVGSTGSTIISFILPGLFYFRLFRSEPGATKWCALALAIYGMGVMTFCLTFNILQLTRART